MSYLVPKITPGPIIVGLSCGLALSVIVIAIFGVIIIAILSRYIKRRYICDRVLYNLLNYLKQATSYGAYL